MNDCRKDIMSELSNTHLASHRFKGFGNSVVFKKRNDAKLFVVKSYLTIKISFIRKLWREKTHQKMSGLNLSKCFYVWKNMNFAHVWMYV